MSQEVSLGERSRTGFIVVCAPWLSGAISDNSTFLASVLWEYRKRNIFDDIGKSWFASFGPMSRFVQDL